jgi:hypothetical protein
MFVDTLALGNQSGSVGGMAAIGRPFHGSELPLPADTARLIPSSGRWRQHLAGAGNLPRRNVPWTRQSDRGNRIAILRNRKRGQVSPRLQDRCSYRLASGGRWRNRRSRWVCPSLRPNRETHSRTLAQERLLPPEQPRAPIICLQRPLVGKKKMRHLPRSDCTRQRCT